jgi:putative transposase
MFKAYKYRIYPDSTQTILLNKHFGCVRYLYNWALLKKMNLYQTEGRFISRYEIQKELPSLKKEFSWLSEVNAQSLQSALINLESAYTRFFREKKGFPRFKSKKDNRYSFQCPQDVKVDFLDSTIRLPKVGKIRAVLSRKFTGKVKTVTVSKTPSGKFFASILTQNEEEIPDKTVPLKENSIGIDVGLKYFATLSSGEKIKNPRFLLKSIVKLKRLSRKHSKKKSGSNNKNKSRITLARQHEKVANQRNDFLHKVSTRIVRDNQTVCVENLNIAGMMKNHKLARAISDVSWGTFISMLEYKCDWYGKSLIKIGRFEPSSKLCTCGALNQSLALKDRVWTCAKCGVTHDRDLLAANNIVRFAFQKQNLIGMGNAEFTSVERAIVPSLKQESI